MKAAVDRAITSEVVWRIGGMSQKSRKMLAPVLEATGGDRPARRHPARVATGRAHVIGGNCRP
jgi:hypothetical protein